MEFYPEDKRREKYQNSFNSQWDGILPLKAGVKDSDVVFQFPMGWNSTIEQVGDYTQIGKFQFPMGWNSTPNAPFYVSL